MESRELDEATPKTTAAWRDSCKKAIIPEVCTQGINSYRQIVKSMIVYVHAL